MGLGICRRLKIIMEKNRKKILIFFLGASVTLVSSWVFFSTLKKAVVGEVYKGPASSVVQVTESLPASLEIPSLGVKAKIQYVLTDQRGDIGIPTNFSDVAWYEKSSIPGNSGVSIISGHLDNGLGMSGVFKNLSELKTGDDVFVSYKDGSKKNFKVYSAEILDRSYSENSVIKNVNGNKPVLSLITCEGKWLSGEKTYENRLVVYAVAQ